jgi:cytochrome P450
VTEDIDGQRVVADFDIHDPAYGVQTTKAEAELRGKCPVAWSNHHGGYWTISGYDALANGLRDRNRFSAEKYTDENGKVCGGITIPTVEGYRALPNESDPPEWDIYRKAISRYLAPAAVAKLQPTIEKYSTEVIDHIIGDGQCDFVMQVGSPVTALITLDLVGLPLADWRIYAEAIHTTFIAEPGPDSGAGLTVVQERLATEVAARRADPETDPDKRRLLDVLLTEDVNGYSLDNGEVKDLIYDILVGGFDTTAGLLAGALRYLEDKPEIKQRLIEDDAYLKTSTEEFLRWISPAVGLAKTATVDIELEGNKIAKGEKMWFMYRAANWDPAEFPNPEVVDLERRPNRHFAFGAGIHRCVGSNVARAVFQVVLREFLIRVPDYAIDHDRVTKYRYACTNAGFAYMPMTYSPGPQVSTKRILDRL